MTPELAGKTAVVTGASRGIGRAVALELGRAGASCLVHARGNRDAADQVAAQIRSAGGEAHVELVDLAKPDGPDRLADAAWGWRGQVDVWVNNAGVDLLTGPLANEPFEEKLNWLWRIDVLATIRLSRRIGQWMKQRGDGVLINLGWDQAETGMEGDSGEMFAAAKGAVMAFTRSLACSLAPQVRVNCIAPGWIKTAWGEQASAAWQRRAVGESLACRWGTPEDVARVARFLAGPDSSFITGQVIAVNGGARRSAPIPDESE
jgi:3-oxoacyl-[acyl-carrier protein] reductase